MAVKNLSRSIVELGRGKYSQLERRKRNRARRRWKLVDGEHQQKDYRDYGRELRYNLGPLYRWLESNIGRPWSKIFSKFSAINDSRSLMGDHILSHLLQIVGGSGGQQYYSFPSPYMPLCRNVGLHGYGGFFIGESGRLERHTDKDCWAWSAERGYFPPKREPVEHKPVEVVPKPEVIKRDPVEVLRERKLERNSLRRVSK